MADKTSRTSTKSVPVARPRSAPDPRPERGGSYRIENGVLVEAEPATAPPTDAPATEEQD